MFSESRVREKLIAISDRTGWVPEYHSLSAIEAFNAHFDALADKAEREEGRREYVQDRLGYDELKWIDNEFRLCACDYRYWSENYAYINANGQIERFKRRASQEMLLELWGERQELGYGIEQQILKARQQGISTEVELAITHQVNFGMGVNAAIASYDSDACERMFGMAQLAFNEQPMWMKANPTSDRAGSFLAFAGNSTRLTQYSGRKASGIARGDTPSVIHISEVSSFPKAKEIIENSLFQSVHPSPRVFMILESTGNGNTDWWANTWYSSRDYWPGPSARLQPVFFPWFIAIDIFPGETWRREHPVPSGWQPLIETRRMMDKCAAYVHNTPLMRRWYGDDWRMPDYQAYFWEGSYLEGKRKGNEKGWYQEMSCVTGNTRVSTEKGIIRIDEAQTADVCESGRIEAWLPRGDKPILEVHTKDGRILRGTMDHLVHCVEGWREIGDLKSGDSLILSRPRFASEEFLHEWEDTPIFRSSCRITELMGRFLGYFMGDGSFDGQGVNVACDARDEDVIEDICSVLREITKREPRRVVVGNMVRVYSCNQYWLPLLRSLGCLKPKMHVEGRTDGMNRKVCVPECIFRSPQNVVRQFLSALYECDGHAYKESPRVKLYSAHDEFLRDVQLLLLGFGIRAKFMKQTLRAGGTVKGGKRHEYTGRSLETPAAFANKFYSDVRFIGKRKQGTGKRQTSLKYSDMSLVDAVDKVVYTGVSEPVYDLTVSDSHRFSANGIEVHNCDDIEALQPKKDLVFDVVETEKQWKQRDGYTVWAITGEQIPERYHPDALEIDYETDRFRTTFQGTVQDITGKHSKELIWEFVPLKQPEEKPGSIFDSDLKLIVFRWPEPGYDYAVACDPSGGTGGDNSVISVMRRSIDGREPDEQVAEFASNRIPQAMLHPFILAIASLYSMEMNDVPLVAIENVYGTGDTAQIQMLEHGYKRHYKFSRLDGKNPKSDKKKSKRLGWYSFDWSRTFMLGQFVNAVHNGWLKLNSPFLLRNEMPAFQIEQTEKGKIRMDHESGKHDDRIFAAAIAYIVFNDTESMSKRVEHKFVGETVEVAVDYGWAQGLVIPYDQVWEGAI